MVGTDESWTGKEVARIQDTLIFRELGTLSDMEVDASFGVSPYSVSEIEHVLVRDEGLQVFGVLRDSLPSLMGNDDYSAGFIAFVPLLFQGLIIRMEWFF